MAGIDLQQNLSQQQILSPQMRQGLELLQANSLELNQVVQQALLTNPVLEQMADDNQLEVETPPEAEHDAEMLSDLDDDWREARILENRGQAMLGVDESARDHFYNSIVAPETLQQHLMQQLDQAAKDEELSKATTALIGTLDDRGFLTEPLSETAMSSGNSLDQLEKARSLIQNFQPAGVGAEDISESLLIQLFHRGIFQGVEARIVTEHLKDLAMKKYPDIAKSLGVSLQAVIDAAEVIKTLTPDPGSKFDPTNNPHITPDIIISFDRNRDLVVELTNAYLPKLTISDDYKDMLASTEDTNLRTFLRDHIRDGRGLIKSISQRQATLMSIAEVLATRQKDFFYQGPQALKPLTMNEVAEIIEVHPTTVSRAATAKYIRTPHGIFELRYFFTTGYETKDGGSLSNTSIRETIQEMISNEDPKKPLSDSALEKQLKEKGIKVARRTIAKYRDQLGILPSNMRKQF